MEKNKVKFGLNKVHWAKILSYQEDGTPNYGEVKRLPGAVNLSIDDCEYRHLPMQSDFDKF